MNFIDRVSLGDKLAQMLQEFHDKDAVILCLQESSLLTCLTTASQIRAWVYPLVYEPVYTPDLAHRLLGAFDQDGKFTPLPVSPEPEAKKTLAIEKIAKKQRSAAMKSVKLQRAGYGLALDKTRLDGRDVILVGDVVTSVLPLVMAQQLLGSAAPKTITAAIGNATPEVAQLVRISAGKSDILDILSGVVYDERRYFEHADTYTLEQKRTLTQHIAAYWQ